MLRGRRRERWSLGVIWMDLMCSCPSNFPKRKWFGKEVLSWVTAKWPHESESQESHGSITGKGRIHRSIQSWHGVQSIGTSNGQWSVILAEDIRDLWQQDRPFPRDPTKDPECRYESLRHPTTILTRQGTRRAGVLVILYFLIWVMVTETCLLCENFTQLYAHDLYIFLYVYYT
jgi:hypothetical protein